MELYSILDIAGGIFINIGILVMNLKQSKRPSVKIKANILIIIGCSSLAIVASIFNLIGNLATQLGVIISSIIGMYNARKDIKNKNKKL